MVKKRKYFGKKKRQKVTIDFDADDRREFLTGFQKRKADRKQKAKDLLKIQLREEKIRLKAKRKENLEQLMESQQKVPEIETIIAENTVTYELPKQVVSITTFDAKQVSGSLGMSLGHNQVVNSNDKSGKSGHKLRKKQKS